MSTLSRVEAGIDGHEPRDALDHQAGGGEHDDREGDFGRDERVRSSREARRAAAVAGRLQRRARSRPRDAEPSAPG